MKTIKNINGTLGMLSGNTYPDWSGGVVNLSLEARNMFKSRKENPLLDPIFCQAWVRYLCHIKTRWFLYGGYMEDRYFLWRGSYLKNNESIHLGIDFSYDVDTPIYCPVSFKVLEVFKDTDQEGGWGTRVTVETRKGIVIFAHLCDVTKEKSGNAGDFIGRIADPYSNGGWFPHLHLQGLDSASRLTQGHLDGYSYLYNGIDKHYPNPLPFLDIDNPTSKSKEE